MDDAQETAQDRERVTVTLTPKAAGALGALCAGGLSKTDAVNRALQAHAFLEEQAAAGAELVIRYEDGTERLVTFL